MALWILALAGIFAVSQILAVVLLLILFPKLLIRQLVRQATPEISRLAAGEPCQTATVLNAISRQLGSEAGRSMKASIMADMSHIQRDLSQDAADQTVQAVAGRVPALGVVLGALGPRARKKLVNNPLIQLAMSGVLGGNGSRPGGPAADQEPQDLRPHRDRE